MKRRELEKNLLISLVSLVLALLIGESLVRLVAPQPYIYPRYQYSRLYGHALRPATTVVEEMPWKWRFEYTVDQYGHRVPTVPVSNRYDLPNLVLLGDSNVFGQGVQDGEEFASVMRRKLAGKANVVNLGVPGYGLTQEIRKFYEFGRLYDPRFVVLVFCGNDLEDNLMNPVTTVQDDRFRFSVDRTMGSRLAGIKEYLSRSYLQHSQLYNLLRRFSYAVLRRRAVAASARGMVDRGSATYNGLLEAFAADLGGRGIGLVFLSVRDDLEKFPLILSKVRELEEKGALTYLETKPWFDGLEDSSTPEGHPWGVRGHRVVGERLSEHLLSVSK